MCFFFSSRRRHTRCALVTGVQTCALPIFTQAGVHAVAAEAAHLEALTDAAIGRREAIAASCDILARIDVAASLADHAMSHNWCRPDLADEPCLDVSGGRHPVVEAADRKSTRLNSSH